MRGLAAFLLIASSAIGQIHNGLEWRAIGPAATGGRISDVDVARVPGHPSEIYVATASGGIFKSINEGVSWFPVFDGAGGMMSMGAIAVARSNPAIVWAGTGEANNRQSSSWGDGVYRSVDSGATWQRMGLEQTRHVGRIAIHPLDPNTVYVAAAGHLWGSNSERGVFKTTDGGATWKKILYRDEHTGAIDVAIDPKAPNIVYAAMYQRQRKGWGFNGGGPGSGIFRSTDSGATWVELKNGLPGGDQGRIGLAISAIDHRVIYATVEAEHGGLFRSSDGGDTWEQLTTLSPRPMYYSRVVLDPADPNRVYLLGSARGLFTSDNGGRTFRDVYSAVHGEDHALWVDPANPSRLIAGGDGGVSMSFDRGASWLFRPNLPIGQFYNISVNNADPYLVCGGLQDNGSWCTPSATNISYGISFREAFNVGGGDGMHALFEDDRTLLVSMQNGAAWRLNLDSMQRQTVGPVPHGERQAGEQPYRWYWTSPMIVSAFDPNVVYTGANILFRSPDRGATWTAVSPDLTAAIDRETLQMMGGPVPPRALSRHDGQANFGALTAIAESPLDRDLLYTGADDGTIQRTNDGGRHWTNLTTKVRGVPPMLHISSIVASKHARGRVYVSIDGHFDDRYDPYIFVSEDFGETWRGIGAGLPQASVRRIREHPLNPNLLVAGTEMGLYATFDRGANWTTLGSNLPTVPVYDVVFQERSGALIAGTHGRGIWILDHVEALGKITPEVVREGAYLFPPAPARHTSIFQGQFWFGAGEFFAPNPSNGAIVSYYLPQDDPGGVEIAVRDAAGATVRTLRGPSKAGLNRGCWDMRWTSAGWGGAPTSAVCAQTSLSGGPLAAPGKYTVVVTPAGAPAMRAELTVLADPKSNIPEAERRVHESALMSAYGLQLQLGPARQAAQALSAQISAMRAVLAGEEAAQIDRVSRDVMRAISNLNNAIAAASRAQAAIDAYEGAPTAAQLRELDWAWEDATTGVATLNRLLSEDMPALYRAAGPSARLLPLRPLQELKR